MRLRPTPPALEVAAGDLVDGVSVVSRSLEENLAGKEIARGDIAAKAVESVACRQVELRRHLIVEEVGVELEVVESQALADDLGSVFQPLLDRVVEIDLAARDLRLRGGGDFCFPEDSAIEVEELAERIFRVRGGSTSSNDLLLPGGDSSLALNELERGESTDVDSDLVLLVQLLRQLRGCARTPSAGCGRRREFQ